MKSFRIANKWSNFAIFSMSVVLILFIGLMVVLNYLSNARLRSSLMEQLSHDLEMRSLSVSYFYVDRYKDLRDLSQSASISDFFINKALGMTMEYGLKSSLLEIHKAFKQLKDKKRIESKDIYNRIIFIDRTGKLLADSNSMSLKKNIPRTEWEKYLMPEETDVRMIMEKDDPYSLIITSPVLFKGGYSGQIISWVSQEVVYNSLINIADRNSTRKVFLACKSQDLFLPPYIRQASGLIDAFSSGLLENKETHRFENPVKAGQDMLAISSPINNTMFSLIMTMPVSDTIGFISPWFLPFAIGLFSVALLTCMLFVIINTKNQVMEARLDEASKRREELEKMNLELMETKQSLAEREERYRMLTGNLPGIVYRLYINTSKGAQFFNELLYPMTGFREEELKYAKFCPLESIIFQEDRDDVVSVVQDSISKCKPFEIEYRVKHKNGDLRYFVERGRPIRGASGEVEYNDGIILDITEREVSEREKRNLQMRLQRAHKMEMVGTLAGGVAHDLNNILSGIISYPELLLLQLPEDSPLRNPISVIKKSGEKAAAVVQDLLTLARRGVVVTEVVNLNEVISDYIASPVYHRLKEYYPGIKLETNIEAGLLNIQGSFSHLSKTVMNLVSNAIEAMPDGGTIVISTKNQYIDKPIKGYDDVKEGDYTVLTVSDNGIGISPSDMERIFEPFYTNKKMSRSGTGLGMTVVWGTVKDHNGYIDVQSTEGVGTIFTLYFPVSREIKQKEDFPFSVEKFKGQGESILVVDDVEEQRQIVSEMLITLGYSVTSVSSGEEAIEYMKRNSVDLLLLDMIMDPGIDGLETYIHILELHPNQKAIIASGYSETARIKEAQRRGAGPYINKPFLLNKIGPAIRAELDK